MKQASSCHGVSAPMVAVKAGCSDLRKRVFLATPSPLSVLQISTPYYI